MRFFLKKMSLNGIYWGYYGYQTKNGIYFVFSNQIYFFPENMSLHQPSGAENHGQGSSGNDEVMENMMNTWWKRWIGGKSSNRKPYIFPLIHMGEKFVKFPVPTNPVRLGLRIQSLEPWDIDGYIPNHRCPKFPLVD